MLPHRTNAMSNFPIFLRCVRYSRNAAFYQRLLANDKDANRRRPELVSRRSTMVPLKIAELLVCLFTATSDTVQIVVGPCWLPAPENARLASFLQQVA